MKDLKFSEIIIADAVRSLRPGYGVAPKYYGQFLGRTAKRDIRAKSPVLSNDIY